MKKHLRGMVFVLCGAALVWCGVSAYFLLNADDIEDDGLSEICAPPLPDANAWDVLNEFSENPPDDKTRLYADYKLFHAYIDGTTNRLEFADDVSELVEAEQKTFDCAEKMLECGKFAIPQGEMMPIVPLSRIINMSLVKAIAEAEGGDVAKGRATLMDALKIGKMVMDCPSYGALLARQVGFGLAASLLNRATSSLFVSGEEEWCALVRREMLRLLDGDSEHMKSGAKMELQRFGLEPVRECVISRASPEWLKSAVLLQGNGFIEIPGLYSRSRLEWNATEKGFASLLLSAFAGYTRYSFQPNRRIALVRKACDRFCRKVDEPYDIEFAKEFDFGSRNDLLRDANPLKRDWLGEILLDWRGFSIDYLRLYQNRFRILSSVVESACKSYRTKYGTYPAALDALVPEFLDEVPRDPYDGEAMHYNSEHFFIWTHGEKLDFNGNIEYSRRGKPQLRAHRRSLVRFLDASL